MQQNSTRMGGTEKLCCAFLQTSIAAGLWRIAKRSPSLISEHSGARGFDAYTKSKHSRVCQFSSMNRIKTALRNRLSNDSLQALMKINCDGPSDNDFDPEEAINNWVTSGPGGRHIAGHKVPVLRASVPNRLTAPATASTVSV